MNSFSVNSCYSVLSACSEKALPDAILEMVVALVDEKKYNKLDPQTMSRDFKIKFKFPLPYHPMQTIIQLGIDKGLFEYIPSLEGARPIWTAIDSGEFMSLLNQKDAEYSSLLDSFDKYLQDEYSLYCSREDLSDQVQSFIRGYGLISKTNKEIFGHVKKDYYFADYLLKCYEAGNMSVLSYVDEYTTGCAFAETLAFGVSTASPANCNAKVFLDTGIIFALLGIGSKDRSENFQELFTDMVRIGMKPCIFKHTYCELEGIIDTAKNWIGNNNYDPSLASETAYFFVTNNWSYQKATELLCDLRKILTEDFHIIICDPPYPKVEDIRSRYEADIKQLIIDEYTRNNTNFCIQDKDYTITQDARSLFLVLHRDANNTAYTLPDIRNIFVTTNRTLAQVGKKLSREIAHGSRTYIPIALTDLTWGTLIWANSPVKISSFNRANIVSAAYAAFHPSPEVLKKLNNTLIESQASGNLSAEKCYFLKTNVVALKKLSQITQNDETRYSDQTPFEILKELQEEGYQKGLTEKQKEVDQLSKEKEQVDVKLIIAQHEASIKSLMTSKEQKKALLLGAQTHTHDTESHFDFISVIKKKSDNRIDNYSHIFKEASILLFVLYWLLLGWLLIKGSWIAPLIGTLVPILVKGVGFFVFPELTFKRITILYETWLRPKVYSRFGFDQEEYDNLSNAIENSKAKIEELRAEITQIDQNLKRELDKVDTFSIDINLVEETFS